MFSTINDIVIVDINDEYESVSRDRVTVSPHPEGDRNTRHFSDGSLGSDDPFAVHCPLGPAILLQPYRNLSDSPKESDIRLQNKSHDTPSHHARVNPLPTVLNFRALPIDVEGGVIAVASPASPGKIFLSNKQFIRQWET